jgi:hypothetical protein
MQRRDILKRTGAAMGAGLLAGCLSGSGDSPGAPGGGGDGGSENDTDGDDDGDGGQESTTTTATEANDQPSALTKKSIEVVDAGCASGGSGGVSVGGSANGSSTTDSSDDSSGDSSDSGKSNASNGASVEFDAPGKNVVVTGTLITSDPCHVAELEKATYDQTANELSVTVEAKRKEGSDVCTSCIGAIQYEASFEFDEGVPASVQVVHKARDETKTVVSANASEESDATTTDS